MWHVFLSVFVFVVSGVEMKVRRFRVERSILKTKYNMNIVTGEQNYYLFIDLMIIVNTLQLVGRTNA